MDGIEELMEFVEIRVQGVEGAIKGDTASVTLNNLLEMTKYVDKTFELVRRFVDIELIAGNVVTKLFGVSWMSNMGSSLVEILTHISPVGRPGRSCFELTMPATFNVSAGSLAQYSSRGIKSTPKRYLTLIT